MKRRLLYNSSACREWVVPLLGWLFMSLSSGLPAAGLPGKISFNHHIKPLLSDRCYACHGPDEKSRKGKLRLDTQESAFKALKDGMFILKPGDPSKSEVYRRITATDPDEGMPPPKSNLSLGKEET